MPVQAYVLIRTKPGAAKKAAEALAKLEGCKAVSAVTGRYDIIMLVEAKDLQSLGALILEKVHRIDGVERTETAMVV
ncbi:MAG: Lrp/AsnC ligand binding domain-containing protein [Thaumarchaeota archaeon]|nr:Lrp/AsnC ligand binding domain-containing protein [Candidatus Calditenuaceae archaeon]MDW8041199.1 Lrp/AsnC ligand binding domain-containing protein [Nitrososphaerota archaeon]